MTVPVSPKRTALLAAARERILVLDGAMGTMIQGLDYDEAAFRGSVLRISTATSGQQRPLDSDPAEGNRGHPRRISARRGRHRRHQHVSSTSIAQADYDLSGLLELNLEGAKLACAAATRVTAEDGRPRFVAGAIGPTNRTASISPDVSNPGYRAVTFDDLRGAYGEQIKGLLDGGADLLLVETIFDTLNAKAALYAIAEITEERGIDVPVMISGTITDKSGRLLSGHCPRRSGIRCGTRGPSPSASTARSAPKICARISPTSAASPTRWFALIRMPGCPTSSASTTRPRNTWPA